VHNTGKKIDFIDCPWCERGPKLSHDFDYTVNEMNYEQCSECNGLITVFILSDDEWVVQRDE
jgi:hypothetical protein